MQQIYIFDEISIISVVEFLNIAFILVSIVILIVEFYLHNSLNLRYYSIGLLAERKYYNINDYNHIKRKLKKLENEKKLSTKILENCALLKINPSFEGFITETPGLIPLNRYKIYLDGDNQKIVIESRFMFAAVIVPLSYLIISIQRIIINSQYNNYISLGAIILETGIFYILLNRTLRGNKTKIDHIVALLEVPGSILFFH